MAMLCIGISIGVFVSATYILFMDKGVRHEETKENKHGQV